MCFLAYLLVPKDGGKYLPMILLTQVSCHHASIQQLDSSGLNKIGSFLHRSTSRNRR